MRLSGPSLREVYKVRKLKQSEIFKKSQSGSGGIRTGRLTLGKILKAAYGEIVYHEKSLWKKKKKTRTLVIHVYRLHVSYAVIMLNLRN